MEEATHDRIVVQTDGIEAALRELLLLDKAFITEDVTDPEAAAAITNAFTQHVPTFDYQKQSNTAEARFSVDNASRRICLQIAQAAAAEKQAVMSYCIEGAVKPSVRQLLDLARCLASIALAEQTLFLHLIADVVEISAIDDCADTFLYLEQCVPYLKAKFSFEAPSAPTKLALLRICNMMLRRLSRAHHVLLAGRIHIFLSQILPSTDRSAVNANGYVNDSHAMEPEDVPEDAVDTDGNPINAAFYKQFWSLQQFFQNPVKAIEPNLWLQAHGSIKAVLQQFARIRPSVASGSINSAVADGSQESLTVKYLSSPKLLHLQLRDAGFRRHFLVQCLILLHACSRRSTSKQDTFKIKQQGEADDLQELLYKELERTPLHGVQFARAVRQLMHHEDHWSDWKIDGAASFERPARALLSGEPPVKRRRISQPRQVTMGTRELTRLWNITPDNLSAIKKPHRRQMPTLREFLDPVIQEMDPEQGIEEQYKKMREPVYRWEALRQIAKVSTASLSSLLKQKDPSLEQAAHMLFPNDIPAGASKKTTVPLPEPSETTALPALEANGEKNPAKSEEEGEVLARVNDSQQAGGTADNVNGEAESRKPEVPNTEETGTGERGTLNVQAPEDPKSPPLSTLKEAAQASKKVVSGAADTADAVEPMDVDKLGKDVPDSEVEGSSDALNGVDPQARETASIEAPSEHVS